MAKYKKKNVFTDGMSGSVGKTVVLKYWNDQLYLANMPGKRKKTSEKQQLQMDRFGYANDYAKLQMTKPERKALYAKGIDRRKTHAYAVAMSDVSHAPKIHEVNANDYHVEAGGMIRVRATDDFRVASVVVRISSRDGRLIEEGNATPRGKRGLWRFTTMVNHADINGTVIDVKATDYALNYVKSSVTIQRP